MARNVATARNSASARTAPTYPRNPIGGLYVKGAKSIEGATGDIARTASGWIENEKYGWYIYKTADAFSGEFDSAVTRTGRLTLEVSNTNVTGRTYASTINPVASPMLSELMKRGIFIKPSTPYTLTCFVKTNNAATDSVYARTTQYNSAGVGGTSSYSSKLTGTNDWTLLTINFTSANDAVFIAIFLENRVAGNVSDAWFDVNSLTLVETGVTRGVVV